MFRELKKQFDTNSAEHSSIWQLIQEFYQEQGPNAWSDHVPFAITNLLTTASTHANIIKEHNTAEQPLRIIDYGAGLGQHGYYLAQALSKLNPDLKFQVILADLSQKCLDYWKNHPQISQYILEGKIVIHKLSGDIETDIKQLQQAFHPQCYILNYIIDSLPFCAIQHGFVQNIKLSAPRKSLNGGKFNGALHELTLQFFCSGEKAPKLFESKSSNRYSIPIHGIKLLNKIFDDSTCTIAIINDKGYTRTEDFAYDERYNLDLEGCYSTDVNFPSIIKGTPKHLYKALHGHQHSPIKTCIISKRPVQTTTMLCPEIAAFIRHYKQHPITGPDQAIAICKTLNHDPFCLELMSQSTHLTMSDTLHETIQMCLKNSFDKPIDYAQLHAARIYRIASETEESLKCLQAFENRYGPHPALHLEYGIHYQNSHPSQAKKHLEAASKDPALYQTAQKIIAEYH